MYRHNSFVLLNPPLQGKTSGRYRGHQVVLDRDTRGPSHCHRLDTFTTRHTNVCRPQVVRVKASHVWTAVSPNHRLNPFLICILEVLSVAP